MCVVDISDEKMDEKALGSSRVDAVVHGVTFYPRSSSHAGSHLKAVPDVLLTATSGSNEKTRKTIQQSKRCTAASKSKTLERRPKSIESLRRTNSNSRLIRKPKYTLLPYKRGQLNLCTKLGNVVVRNGIRVTLNSDQAAEKETKTDSDNCGDNVINAIKDNANTVSGTSRRFFKANFGSRRKFTLNVRGMTSSHIKLDYLKQHKRNTALGIKQLCVTVASECSEPERVTEAVEESCKTEHSTLYNADTTCEDLFEDAVHNSCKSTEANVESNQEESSEECTLTNDCDSTANIQQHSGTVSLTDAASAVTSTPKLYSDNASTSPSLKHGTSLSSVSVFTAYVLASVLHIHIVIVICADSSISLVLISGPLGFCACVEKPLFPVM